MFRDTEWLWLTVLLVFLWIYIYMSGGCLWRLMHMDECISMHINAYLNIWKYWWICDSFICLCEYLNYANMDEYLMHISENIHEYLMNIWWIYLDIQRFNDVNIYLNMSQTFWIMIFNDSNIWSWVKETLSPRETTTTTHIYISKSSSNDVSTRLVMLKREK